MSEYKKAVLPESLKITSLEVLKEWIKQFPTKDYPEIIECTQSQLDDYKKIVPDSAFPMTKPPYENLIAAFRGIPFIVRRNKRAE